MRTSWLLRLGLASCVGAAVLWAPALDATAQDRAPGLQDEGDAPPPQPPPGDDAPPPTPPPAGEGGDAGKPSAGGGGATPPQRELDTTSPAALALDELLNVDPRYGKDGRVELTYGFEEEAELLDWANQGFDRVDVHGGNLTLGVGSQGQGLIQHTLELQGAYEVVFKVKLEWVSSRSDLVFLLGQKGGARFGNQFVERQSRGFRPVARVEPARERFNGARDVTLRYLIEGDDVSVWLNGIQLGRTNKLKRKLDGRVGMWMTDMRMVVQEVQIKGTPDASKL